MNIYEILIESGNEEKVDDLFVKTNDNYERKKKYFLILAVLGFAVAYFFVSMINQESAHWFAIGAIPSYILGYSYCNNLRAQERNLHEYNKVTSPANA